MYADALQSTDFAVKIYWGKNQINQQYETN